MFDLAASDPVLLEPGDELAIVNEVRRGAIVRFERIAPNKVEMRALDAEEQHHYGGPLYRIDRGERPGTVVLRRYPTA